MKLTHKHTMIACYNGYITQAICINFLPLLYTSFQNSFQLSYSLLATLIAINFIVELSVDLFATMFASKLNIRLFTVIAHVSTTIGLCALSFLPFIISPFVALCIIEVLTGLGGGLTEVMISPIMEACPTSEKSGNMSFLHSFYAWGSALVILITGFIFLFIKSDLTWRYIPFVWAVFPLIGAIIFSIVPIYNLDRQNEEQISHTCVPKKALLILFIFIMVMSGAAELTISQWASTFAETALNVNKTMGDILGPGLFAITMGCSRLLYGLYSKRLKLFNMMFISCGISVFGYILCAYVQVPLAGFIGCALCGFGVGIFWPGTLSLASSILKNIKISTFALLALAGDMGCLLGPFLAGIIADHFSFYIAFAFSIIYPLSIVFALFVLRKKDI